MTHALMTRRLLLAAPVAVALADGAMERAGAAQSAAIDDYSYRLGSFSAFAEMVHRGVKKLALSSPMAPSLMDRFIRDAQGIAAAEQVQIRREDHLLITDLFPAEKTAGKSVLLIYRGSTLEEYLALKRRKQRLLDSRAWCGEARADIARAFGAMLSYPPEAIAEMIPPAGSYACG